ncbi:hypothetical protein Agabi119p4_3312 [Agaricus bisporus var. burnettii]|uniref:Uncharacterized protein n=1 Tax=Agaricus bisporus var. burnettii TaxID=192524 RepID=A0A8H7F6U7_AGABI|nr:hypothetical protein Agabi119p4_3312 [Agaricus bisporus var. burnettii]
MSYDNRQYLWILSEEAIRPNMRSKYSSGIIKIMLRGPERHRSLLDRHCIDPDDDKIGKGGGVTGRADRTYVPYYWRVCGGRIGVGNDLVVTLYNL